LLLSFGMFVFNDQVANEAGFQLRKTTKQLILKHPRALIEAGRFVKLSENIIFLAKRVEGDILYDIVAYEIGQDDEPVRTIIAERGELITLVEESAIKVTAIRNNLPNRPEKWGAASTRSY
ncbi:MAG: LptF/LptG family permease, partial [Planctomycetes bacterium]|nr:LptF/LptG family permease [Planctomycetota bacterium]